MPQKIFIKRLDTQLSMWVLEAKNFPPKKKYVLIFVNCVVLKDVGMFFRFFAQIYLDKFLYAQTCAKSRVDDTLFWGEPFSFV